ncbi:MAG: hypothetical protein ISN29_01470 [Gammaproteobacteria bacterium AqS3]|nr:hypothetical protein [Gammaproteobacteria bacterium AqS3]
MDNDKDRPRWAVLVFEYTMDGDRKWRVDSAFRSKSDAANRALEFEDNASNINDEAFVGHVEMLSRDDWYRSATIKRSDR